MRRNSLVLALLLVAHGVVTSGCDSGANTVWVTGRLLKGGTKYVAPTTQRISVTLVALGSTDQPANLSNSGEPYWAEVDQAEGTFSVPGKERQGIPVGKYRVVVVQRMSREAFDAANPKPKKQSDRDKDLLGDRFGNDTSPIIREVTTSQELVIDLDRPIESPTP